jgi:transposase
VGVRDGGVGVTRDEKISRARELRVQGMSYAAVGDALGVEKSTAMRWLNPERTREWVRRSNAKRAAAKLAWQHAHRMACPNCGDSMGLGSSMKSKQTETCRRCRFTKLRSERETRRSRIAAMWNAGKTATEIAEALDSTPGSISVELTRMRHDGWSVPPHYAARREAAA